MKPASMDGPGGFAELRQDGRELRIEMRRIEPPARAADAPLVVFLHEGLGSVAMWKDFPDRVCEAGGLRGLVYSRPGYGRSTPRPAHERWAPDFMHRQAREVLPALLDTLGVREPVWLVGHSDGGSIALLHAALHPSRTLGVVAMAPHLFVEDLSLASIEQAREAWRTTDLRARLARYHDDPESAFHGWNDIWLDPAFRDWNIEAEVATIRRPVLAMQGVDDAYGTLAQIHRIAELVPGTRLVEIPQCGHSPHRDQPETAIVATTSFIASTRSSS